MGARMARAASNVGDAAPPPPPASGPPGAPPDARRPSAGTTAPSREARVIELYKPETTSILGITCEESADGSHVIITALSASGLAAQSGLLSVGDKLISVDDSPLPNDPNETARRLRACRGIMRIGIKPGDGAPPPPPPPSGAQSAEPPPPPPPPGASAASVEMLRRGASSATHALASGARALSGMVGERKGSAAAPPPPPPGGPPPPPPPLDAATAEVVAQLAAAALDQFGADAARAAREAAAEYEVPEIADAVVEAVLTARVRAIADWEAEANELLRKAS